MTLAGQYQACYRTWDHRT